MRKLHNTLEHPVVSYHAIPSSSSSATKNSNITIVYIDHKSLIEQGQWPWSGKQYTHLVNSLINNGADNIAFDIPVPLNAKNEIHKIYAWLKKNRGVSTATARALNRASKHFDYKTRFSKRLKGQDIILGFEFTSQKTPSMGYLPAPIKFLNKFSMRAIPNSSSYIGNLRKIQQTGLHGGFNNVASTQTDIAYKTPLLKRYGDQVYPALSLQLVRSIMENRNLWLHWASDNINFITAIKLDETTIPTDKAANVTFRFQGPPGTIPSLSATDLISRRLSQKVINRTIRDKTIIISSNIQKIRPSVKIAQYLYTPAEIHANVINSIMTGQVFTRSTSYTQLDVYMLIVTGLILTLLLPSADKRQRRHIVIFIMGTWFSYHLILLNTAMYISALSIPFVMMLSLLLFHSLADNDMVVLRIQLMTRWIQTQYPILNFGGKHSSTDNKIYTQESSILFVHIRNFSQLSEHINPVELNKILGLFSNPIASLINRHQGQVAQHIGHTILAVWPSQSNSPADIEKVLDQAITCALKIRHISSALQTKLSKKGLPELEINIGIDSGNVKTRALAWQAKLTCGQVVDNAWKLSNLCEFYGVNIIVSHKTNKPSPEFYYRQLDILDMPGQADKVAIYEPLCQVSNIDLCDYYELQLYERALEFFMEGNKEHATSFFKYLHKARPYRLIYDKYLKELEKNPLFDLRTTNSGLLNKRALNQETPS